MNIKKKFWLLLTNQFQNYNKKENTKKKKCLLFWLFDIFEQ